MEFFTDVKSSATEPTLMQKTGGAEDDKQQEWLCKMHENPGTNLVTGLI